MRKRKERIPDNQKTLENEEEEEEAKNNGFFACYLLTSLNPRFKGHTYIGFTVNPRRRIRQHNGEIGSGAWRTKSKRPWEMVFCIYGFPTNVSALQFEWAWQHPIESLAVRQAASAFKSLSGLVNKIKLAYTMLTLPAWNNLNITVNYFSTKYTVHSAQYPSLPQHMKVRVCPMDELPCYTKNDGSSSHNAEDLDNEEFNGALDASCTSELVDDLLRGSQVYDNNRSSENFPWTGECQRSQPSSSSSLKEDFCPAFEVIVPPVNASIPAVSSPRVVEVADDLDLIEIGQATSSECNSTRARQMASAEAPGENETATVCPIAQDKISSSFPNMSTGSPVGQDKISSSCPDMLDEVEVIDLYTPSPDCRISLGGKRKRKSSRVCPDIIDLTKSPVFVQL